MSGGARRAGWAAGLLCLAAAGAARLAGQEFRPPPLGRSPERGTQIGLFGFGVRAGPDLSGRSQLAFGAALDAGNVFTQRLRLRPSVDFGLFNGPNTYVGSVEAAYRFTADAETVTPYAGGGLAVAGHDRCGADPACPALWATLVLGFEIHYRSTFNWLLEYRGMAGFRHNRLYVGLTTRRGS